MNSNVGGGDNVAIGFDALQTNVSGSQNTAVGDNSLNLNTGGSNIALGYHAGDALTTGNYNIDIGNNGLATDGVSVIPNTGIIRIGDSTRQSDTYLAGVVHASGGFFGAAASGANTDITSLSGIDSISLTATNAAGTHGVISIGAVPFINAIGGSNTFVGPFAGNFTMGGTLNTGIGASALSNNASGNFNTATGNGALTSNSNGNDNTASGNNALHFNNSGFSNTAIGSGALLENTTGSSNTALGAGAGFTAVLANANTSGSNNTFIGYQSGPGTSTQYNNATAIGANALVSQDNSMVLGDGTVKVGIGTSTPTAALDVVGVIKASGGFIGSLTGSATSVPFSGVTSVGLSNATNGGNLVIGGTGTLSIGTSALANANLEVQGNGRSTLIGDPGLGSGFAGLGVQGTLTSTSYTLLGNGTDLYINRPTGGNIYFREGNNSTSQMILGTGGAIYFNSLIRFGSTISTYNGASYVDINGTQAAEPPVRLCCLWKVL